MIVETRKIFCDACKREITHDIYTFSRDVIEIDEEGFAHSIGYNFCEDCAKSFVKWLKGRENIHLGGNEKENDSR